jgi:hypothetical protein
MNHYTEEELILFYYKESDHSAEIEEHLGGCERCREVHAGIEKDLGAIDDLPFPTTGPGYSRQVWEAIEPRLEARPIAVPESPARNWRVPMAAAAGLILTVTSLWIGYRAGARGGGEIIDQETRRQALMSAVSMHLQSSERLLVELSNVDRRRNIDLAGPQKRAASLASTNRLYRRTADHQGESELAALLDELERVLLDVANAPDRISPAEFNTLWSRVERSGLLIKMRLQEVEVREGPAANEV